MNGPFSLQDLETLIAPQGKPAVSIYLTTSPIPTHAQAENVELRNLLREAESELEKFGLRGPAIRALLEPAQALITDSDFWRHQQDGLALFLSEETFLYYKLPFTFATELIVAESFRVKPLMPALTNNAAFYILAVSQNHVRLLHGNRFAVQEIDPTTFPTSLAEALRLDESERQIQFHSSTSTSGAGRRGAVFFGHGGGATNDDKVQLRHFFEQINHGLREYIQDQTVPLVFAGVDYLFPIYREANTYPHLVESSIVGNPEGVHADQLRQEAWKLLEPIFSARQAAEIEEYYNLAAHGQASANVQELVPWADQGRVLTAFVDKDASMWGVYDPAQFKAEVHDVHTSQSRDLTDLVAVYTLLRKGTVYLLSNEEMEMEFGAQNRHRAQEDRSQLLDDTPAVAAIYRYAIE